MAEIINLKRVRRARAQAQAKAKAAENRVVHGRTKAECARDSKQKADTSRKLDALRREEP